MSNKLRVTVWNEYKAETMKPAEMTHYPDGLHEAIASFCRSEDWEVRTALLQQEDHGLGGDVLEKTDVLIWFGHFGHAEVKDEIVEKVQKAVLSGMGLVVLHSGHHSKIFRKLMGTSCNLAWREHEGGELVRLWAIKPNHPIMDGLPAHFDIPYDEMYGEPFDIPEPDETVLIGWYEGGEVFRSGCCFYRGNGKIFYFSAGHETFPVYNQAEVQKVIVNGVRLAHSNAKRNEIVNTKRAVPLSKIAARA